MTIRHALAAVVCIVTALPALTLGGCKKEVRGACEVDYDLAGSKGEACTDVLEESCVDSVSPPINMLATTTKKGFVAGKTCKDVGYATAGCSDIPIAWQFKGGCPR